MAAAKAEETLFEYLEDMIHAVADGVRPPKRQSVATSATELRKLNNPGAYIGDWKNEKVPYLVEPMEVLTSLEYTGMIFVGPAQAGKTDMFLNWLAHTVVHDPADMMLIQTAMNTAKDFARRRVDRMHRHSPDVGKHLLRRRDADSVFMKQYLSGMLLSLSWPTINELSGRPVPRLWLTDYDRMTQDIDGEGNPFDLARKRATTFRRHGMTAAESSPGFEVTDLNWVQPKGSHMAPPAPGILSLYNRGDRRLFYWTCPQCELGFEPDFHMLHYPKSEDLVECGEAAVMVCPHCSFDIRHDKDPRYGYNGKYDLNNNGVWVPDGMALAKGGTLVGKRVRSDIASFWLKGVCAAFADWKTLVINFEKADREYELTGSETALKTTVNVDQARAYIPKALSQGRLLETLKERADTAYEKATIPRGVRFLIATVDVQKHRFEVRVWGFGPGGDQWLIDYFVIRKSKRLDDDGERYPVTPHAYPEDWELLYEQVMQKTYPLADGSGRLMRVKTTGCDSGGKSGVTSQAYDWYRRLLRNEDKDDPENGPAPFQLDAHLRFQLVKGRKSQNGDKVPRVSLTYPDSERSDRHADARGEVPVLLINTDEVKTFVDNMFDRKEAGGGRLYFPANTPDSIYNEFLAEVKTAKGWENLKKLPNETFDLAGYARAIAWYSPISLEYIDWTNPEGWAKDWEENTLVYDPNEGGDVAEDDSEGYDLAELGELLG